MKKRLLFLFGPILLAVYGCSPAPEEQPDIDALRALPYTGLTSHRAGEEGGVVLHDRERAYPGYNLYTNWWLCETHLIDMEGRSLNRWTHSPCRNWSNAELLANGDLIVGGCEPVEPETRQASQESCFLMRLSWSGETIWSVPIFSHHDTELTPRNQLATLTNAWRRIPQIDPGVDVRDQGIALLDLEGRIEERASFYEMLSGRPDLFSFQSVAPSEKLGELEIDLFHANSLEWMHHEHLFSVDPIYGPENVLISMRHQDSVAIIDWNEKRVVWAWGQGELSGPHDATVLENGRLLIFDNGLGRDRSRVIELDPLTRQIVWEYGGKGDRRFHTRAQGANQRLPNGNTLITNSDNAEAFEITPTGDRVWEFLNPSRDPGGLRAAIVRMRRYDPSLFDGLTGDTTPISQVAE